MLQIVMPKRLGGGPGTDIQEMPALSEEQLRELYGRREMGQAEGEMLQPRAYRDLDPQAMHRSHGVIGGHGDMRAGGTDMEQHINNVGHRQRTSWYR